MNDDITFFRRCLWFAPNHECKVCVSVRYIYVRLNGNDRTDSKRNDERDRVFFLCAPKSICMYQRGADAKRPKNENGWSSEQSKSKHNSGLMNRENNRNGWHRQEAHENKTDRSLAHKWLTLDGCVCVRVVGLTTKRECEDANPNACLARDENKLIKWSCKTLIRLEDSWWNGFKLIN